MELILKQILSALQISLAIWQFGKLTRLGALIQGVVGWLLHPLGLSPPYSLLQHYRSRVFKRVNCFTLEADISSVTMRDILRDEANKISLNNLGSHLVLERREKNMLFIKEKMCYYITDTIWEELQILGEVLLYGLPGPAGVASVCIADACADVGATAGAARVAMAARMPSPVFLKGYKKFWNEVTTGDVMTLNEVLDAVIIYNQHVSQRLNEDWLLPVNLSVLEEGLRVLNLIGLFLHTRKDKIHWLIPTSLTFISTLMELSARLRVWIYIKINVLFCDIMHFICDPLPRS